MTNDDVLLIDTHDRVRTLTLNRPHPAMPYRPSYARRFFRRCAMRRPMTPSTS